MRVPVDGLCRVVLQALALPSYSDSMFSGSMFGFDIHLILNGRIFVSFLNLKIFEFEMLR